MPDDDDGYVMDVHCWVRAAAVLSYDFANYRLY